jgi:hypothetical protein
MRGKAKWVKEAICRAEIVIFPFLDCANKALSRLVE